MLYAGLSSRCAHAVHWNFCTVAAPRRNSAPLRAMVPAPHFGQSPVGVVSSAANRRSSSSMRPGAARIRFHSPQRSSSASISERTANAVS